MIIADGEMRCSTCGTTPMKGIPMLEGSGGSVYCSPDCSSEGEDDPVDTDEEDED